MQAAYWNLWHGCHKKSEGCEHCYMHRRDAKYGLDLTEIKLNKIFRLPVQKDRQGEYKIPSGTLIYTCFTSDFLIEEADDWRAEAWEMIRERSDCRFIFLTKRIERFMVNLPHDWGEGWEHVSVGCTCENQQTADERLPIFVSLPVKHRIIINEPLLSAVNMKKYLPHGIESVSVGGESGPDARICDYDWVLDIRRQCIEAGVSFNFRQTGARLRKDGRLYRILRKMQHSQAKKANINT